MLLRVLDSVLARHDVPLAPRSNHIEMRRNGLVRQLETYLIISLPCAAMSECVTSGFQGHFGLPLGQQRPRNRRAEKILMFVHAAGAHELPEILGDKLLAHVLDVHFGSSGFEGLLLESVEFFSALSDIPANRDDLAAIVF